MSLSTNIDLQNILVSIGRAYQTDTSGSSIVSTVAMSTGPQYSVSLARNLVSAYTNGNNPVVGTDYDILSKFGTDLRSLEVEINTIYQSLQTSFLSAEFSKLNTFITNAYGTNIRSYLNNNTYDSTTGPVYDVHGGFAQSYLDYNGQSLIFKVADIICSGSIITMVPGPLLYPGTGGYTKCIPSTFSGPWTTISDENTSTYLFSGSNNIVMEYIGISGAYFGYILGSSGSYRTLAYPRIYNAGYSGNTGASMEIGVNGVTMSLTQEPAMRKANANNVYLLKAKTVVDDGDRDFVFKMVKSGNEYAAVADTEQTQTATVAGAGDTATIVGTTGNTSFYRPFSLVSAANLQNGEVFEIWVAQ
jgi:hypothetical protein